jgi:hypothetical protein
MRDFAMKRLIPLWIGFAAFLAIIVIALTAETSLAAGNNTLAVVLLVLAIPANIACFTLVRAMLGAYGFGWFRLAALLVVPFIPFGFLAVVTWKNIAATSARHEVDD